MSTLARAGRPVIFPARRQSYTATSTRIFLFQIVCLLIVVLILISNSFAVEDWRSCEGIKCAEGHACVMRKLTCVNSICNDVEPIPICIPFDPSYSCATLVCKKNQQCVHLDRQCFNKKCYPEPVCKDYSEKIAIRPEDIAIVKPVLAKSSIASQNLLSLDQILNCMDNPKSNLCSAVSCYVDPSQWFCPVPLYNKPPFYYVDEMSSSNSAVCDDNICSEGYICSAYYGKPYCYSAFYKSNRGSYYMARRPGRTNP